MVHTTKHRLCQASFPKLLKGLTKPHLRKGSWVNKSRLEVPSILPYCSKSKPNESNFLWVDATSHLWWRTKILSSGHSRWQALESVEFASGWAGFRPHSVTMWPLFECGCIGDVGGWERDEVCKAECSKVQQYVNTHSLAMNAMLLCQHPGMEIFGRALVREGSCPGGCAPSQTKGAPSWTCHKNQANGKGTL